MIIINVFDNKTFEWGFGCGENAAIVPHTAKTLKKWQAELKADLVFNLAFFNMSGEAGVKYRTIQFLHIPKLGDCGYGGTEQVLTLPGTSEKVSGWKVGVEDGAVVSNDIASRRSRNMLGILMDGRLIQVQTDLGENKKGYTEKEVCTYAAEYARKKLGSRIKLLLIMDAGGSTGCYSGRAKLLFAPEKKGKDGRAVASVFWVRLKPNAPKIKRALYQGLKGDDVKLLQMVIGGVEIDGSYGPATRARVIEVQKSLGLTPDGMAGPLTLAALALR